MPRGPDPLKAKEWSDRLKRFKDSSETVAQFCSAECVSPPAFYQWRRKLGMNNQVHARSPKRKRTAKRRGKHEPAFTPIQLTPASFPPQSATIRLSAGIEIELGDNLQVVEMVVRCVVRQALGHEAGGTSC